ncbi:MAG: D-arabinono-1,4-lactone oxidase [Gammaproteobacteria bacterium]
MDTHWTRRTTLRNAFTALVCLSAPGGLLQAGKTGIKWRNWGGNLSASPANILAPDSEAALVQAIANSPDVIRPVGSSHSWSPLAPTDGTMVSLDRLSGIISTDAASLQAELWGGTKLFALGPMLEEVGQAVVNMSDINYQTLAGAIATSTHGTGANLGAMSSYVSGLRLITTAGDTIDCDADNEAELFNAARTSLGALGFITRIRMQNQASIRLHQREWLADMDETLENIDQLNRENQLFELFPIPNSERTIVVVTNPAAAGVGDTIEDEPNSLNDLREGYSWVRKLPFGQESALNTMLDIALGGTTDRIGPLHKVLAHPRTTRFMEMEYTVPAERGVACLREILAKIKSDAPGIVFPLEVRYIKADNTMIGMFSEQDGCAISIHQFADEPNWKQYFSLIEPIFHKYQGRPHWGKWHSLDGKQLRQLYPQWDRFRRIRQELDPGNRMINPYLGRLLEIA